jgi:Flp pilus assembly protein TadD
MSVNELFNKANKCFLNQDYFQGLKIYEQIWIKYPRNMRLYEEINKKINKLKKPILQTYTEREIKKFFELERLGQVLNVIKTLNENIKINPNDVLTISLLGNFYNSIKNYDKAIYFQKLAIEKSPLEGTFYLNISKTLQNNGELEEALQCLKIAKILSLKDKTIDYEIAKLQTKMKFFFNADLIYKDLIKEKNINKKVIYSYCDNLIKNKKEKDAIQYIEAYEKKNGTDDNLKLLLGLAHFQQRKFNKAKSYFLLSLKLQPNNTNTLNMLGNAYLQLGNYNKAKNFYDEALKLKPNNKITLNNLAALSFYNGELLTAENLYIEAIEKTMNNYEAVYNLAQCQLARLNFTEGWKNFKFRWLANQFNSPKIAINLPEFQLNSDKKNLLVWAEQGLGDIILFLRFLRNLEPHVDNLFIKIDKRLHQMINRNFSKTYFINENMEILKNKINYQLPIGNTGSLFIKNKSDLKSFSKKYIKSDPIRTNNLKKYLKKKEQFICGLSWVSKNEDIGANKSITLETLKPVLSLQNIKFIDLQYNDTKDEREHFFQENNICISKINEIDSFNDIEGITSLIDACDFIITVSNTNAHIAGALGKKTFLLLPKGKGRLWYWSSSKNQSLWYSSIEVIEQDFPGEWEPVINEVKTKVRGYISE